MMSAIMRHELELTLKDLRLISIRCGNCRTVVTMDMERKEDVSPKTREGAFSLRNCPICGNAYDSALPSSIDSIHRAYQGVREDLRDLVTFRTPGVG